MHALLSALMLTAAPQAAAAAPAPAPAAAKPAELPSSCNAQAKPLVAAALDAAYNARVEEARAKLKEATAADAKCALAKALMGSMSPGGKKLVEEASAMTAGATEVEKLLVQALSADSAGDAVKTFELVTKARDAAPNVVILNVMVAVRAQSLNRFDDMLAAAKKATEVDPKSGAAWNQLGYAHVGKKQWDDAVGAFKKYVEIAPTEANAHDSLADALLRSGKVDEAGAEYQKAVDAKLALSHSGLAAVKGIKADWAGARAEADAMRDGVGIPELKLEASLWKAAAFAADGKLPDALKTLDQTEKDATGAKVEFFVGLAPIFRGDLLVAAGKPADAIKQYGLAEKAKLESLSDADKRLLAGWRLAGLTDAQARSGKAADAAKTAAKVEELFKPVPADVTGQDLTARSRGLAALSKKDFKAAVEAFSKCTDEADVCRVELAEAQEKSGDAAAATATREQVLSANHRSPTYLEARMRLATAAPGKKVASETKKK